MAARTRFALALFLAAGLAAPAWAFRHLAPGQRVSCVELRNPAGETVRLPEDGRRATLVLFWATWSPRSLKALSDLEGLYRAHEAEGFRVVAVNVEGEGLKAEDEARIAAAAGRAGVTYGVALDRDLSVYSSWGVGAVPSAVLVDGEGRVLELLAGYPPGLDAKLQSLVAAALEGARADAAPAGPAVALGSEPRRPEN